MDGWRIGLHSLEWSLQLSFLFPGLVPDRARLFAVTVLAAAIFRIITVPEVFVVQSWTGDVAAGVEWSGPARGS